MYAPGAMLKPSDDLNSGLTSEDLEQRAQDIADFTDKIIYSKRYSDNFFEYRYSSSSSELVT